MGYMHHCRHTVIAVFCSALSVVAHSQTKLTDVEIVGHVYEPQRLSPTDERIGRVRVPPGFHLQRFAEGLENPRFIAVADDGAIYVTQRMPGNVVMLRDTDGDGVGDVQKIVARIKDVHGIAIRGREIYLVDIHRIYVASLQADGSLGALRILVRGLPDGGQHPNRTLGFDPQGNLFVSVGSTCNECREPNPLHATLLRHAPRSDCSGRARQDLEVFASGLRNSLAYDWHPGSGRLYAFDNGIDWLGDDAQSEEINEILPRQRYGWPYVYDADQINPHTEPSPPLTSEAWARLSEAPVGFYTPHSAPMQMRFYTGAQLPESYRSDAFVVMRGSWNRKPPSGYEVVRLRFDAAGDFQSVEPFIDGFLQELPAGGHGFIARPVGLAVASDGALIVGDDTNNILFRASYGAATGTPSPQRAAYDIFDAPATIEVTSPAFQNGGVIPREYSAYGKNVSPPLRWRNIPEGTRSLVLLMEDEGAVAPLPFVHWIASNLEPDGELPASVTRQYEPPDQDIRQGSNSISQTGYFGPRPPLGDPPHTYRFQLFALDAEPDLPDGFNRHALLQAIRGHVLAKGELRGLFAPPE